MSTPFLVVIAVQSNLTRPQSYPLSYYQISHYQSMFMDSNTVFILKVLILSLIISVAIKYVGPYLAIPATSLNAIIAVSLPAILVGTFLIWRTFFDHHNSHSPR